MTIPKVTRDDIRQAAERIGLTPDSDLLDAIEAGAPMVGVSFDVMAAMSPDLCKNEYPRNAAKRPLPDENPLNAWAVKGTIEGAATGPLSGKKIVVKDTVNVAGWPLRNGSLFLDGHTPNTDATIVTRMLDAGGTIVGKSVCEALSLSIGSHTSEPAPVKNPRNIKYSAGGSSSGSAALVAAGEVDMAIGGDQGGSIRIPSSACGIYGMKPTHGLVPYTGIMPLEMTIDHAGPMTATVEDNALLLEVLAGPDGLDPRQKERPAEDYRAALTGDVKGLSIAAVTEGFEQANSEPDVNEAVRKASQALAGLGADVSEISLPALSICGAAGMIVNAVGFHRLVFDGLGLPTTGKGFYDVSLMHRMASSGFSLDTLPVAAKTLLVLGEHLMQNNGAVGYGMARNVLAQAKAHIDDVFGQVDLLLMPTMPKKPFLMPEEPLAPIEQIALGWDGLNNTSPFNATGHPAMSVPCGVAAEGVPVGMMLVGPDYGEKTIYRAAHGFEQHVDWRECRVTL